jgi:hypothetical protein
VSLCVSALLCCVVLCCVVLCCVVLCWRRSTRGGASRHPGHTQHSEARARRAPARTCSPPAALWRRGAPAAAAPSCGARCGR